MANDETNTSSNANPRGRRPRPNGGANSGQRTARDQRQTPRKPRRRRHTGTAAADPAVRKDAAAGVPAKAPEVGAAASKGTPAGGAAASFSELGLPANVLAAIADLGYEQPSPVQLQAIPLVLGGRDVMAAAQTGTGKTAAFLLPTLARLGHARRGEGPLMLVVTPTRELAQQIEACAETICARTGHTCCVLVGGVGYGPQREALARGCDLLVATPGRLIDLMNEGTCKLGQVSVLVLDEADRMLDMGFLPSMRKIVAATPAERQTLLFSATLGPDVLENTKSLVRDPARVEIARKGTAAETIDQYVLGVEARAKVRTLVGVLGREGSSRVIVFCRGKHRADAICRQLRKAGVECAPIHGNRTQGQRENALRRFTNGEVGVLVATDVLARGIDIAEVAYVVNLDVPSDAEDYIHRIGRTGRAGAAGWALTFVSEDEYLDLRDIEQLMGKVVPVYPRAEGLDVGESPFEPDPRRDPREKLPGKQARKKMREQREAVRAVQAGGGAGAQPAPRARTSGQAPQARRVKAGGKGSGGAAGDCGAAGAAGDRGARIDRSVTGASATHAIAARPSGMSSGKGATSPRPRRRPGDHGGA